MSDNRDYEYADEGCFKGFLHRHFGTDLLLAAWLYVIGSLLFIAMAALDLYETDNSDDATDETVFFYELLLGSSFIFLVGSCVFVKLAYPASIDKAAKEFETLDLEKLNFFEKYFAGNDYLIMAWLFFLGAALVLVYPIWALSTDVLDLEYGMIYLAILGMIVSIFLFWIITTLPQNMMLNGGKGSSHIHDIFCACFKFEFLKTHFGTDFIILTWFMLFFALMALAGGIYLLAAETFAFASLLALSAAVVFFMGTIFFIRCSYPNSSKDDCIWRMITCQGCKECHQESSAPSERTSLLHNNNNNA